MPKTNRLAKTIATEFIVCNIQQRQPVNKQCLIHIDLHVNQKSLNQTVEKTFFHCYNLKQQLKKRKKFH